MRKIFLLLVLSLIGIQNISAQTSAPAKINPIITNNIDESLFPNVAGNVLKIKNDTTIDFVRLYNENGQLVVQLIPVQNQVDLNGVKPGFYMVHGYKEGKEVNKSILKKI